MVAECFEDVALDDSSHTFISFEDSPDLEDGGMLSNSKDSGHMHCMSMSFLEEEACRIIDPAPLECNSMRWDSIQVEENKMQSSCNHTLNNNAYNTARIGHRRISQPPPSIQVNNATNSEPAPYNHQQQQYLRQSSCNDLDMMETSSYITKASTSNYPPPNNNSRRPHRRVTVESLSSSSSSIDQMKIFDGIDYNYNSGVHQEVSYEEALQNLADSMRRTKLSRQQLMVQRALILIGASEPLLSSPPHCHHPLSKVASARQQLQERILGERCPPSKLLSSVPSAPAPALSQNHQSPSTVATARQRLQERILGEHCPPTELLSSVRSAPAATLSQNHQPPRAIASAQRLLQRRVEADPIVSASPLSVEYISGSPTDNDRFSKTAAFFSGSRSTLTNGLEHSRMQLNMYMDQLNNQTL